MSFVAAAQDLSCDKKMQNRSCKKTQEKHHNSEQPVYIF